MVARLMNEGKILACGNGGSAADAQHFAAEMGRFEKSALAWQRCRWPPTPSALTAIGNDYDFDMVFSKQVRALGQTGDILLAISTRAIPPM